MGGLLKSKFFWIMLVTLVPSFIAWVKIGIEGAVAVLVLSSIISICILASGGSDGCTRRGAGGTRLGCADSAVRSQQV